MKIPYALPNLSGNELRYVMDAAENGWGDNCFDYIERFEKYFAEYIGSSHALATSSCTGALVLSLKALGVGPGDEVILADSNWVAAASAILTVGAIPVPVEVDSDTWCILPSAVRQAITVKTRALIATHLYGNVAAVSNLKQLATEFDLALIEDSAESLGSTLDSRHTGTFGHVGVFSFHGTKLVTTGEGGMVVTDDPELFERMRTLNNHGRSSNETKQFWSSVPGYKFKMSNIQAALGLAQMELIEDKVRRKREIFAEYRENLRHSQGLIQMNPEPHGVRNSYWMPTVIFADSTGVTRDAILSAFRNVQIDARVFFWPLSEFDFITSRHPTPVAHGLSLRGINLPSFEAINSSQIRRVTDVIVSLLDKGDH